MKTPGVKNMPTRELNEEKPLINPKKVVLWLFIVASIMLFAAFTSAYIVRRGEGNWEVFNLPTLFTYNTFVIILGSLFVQLAYFAAKKDELVRLKAMMGLTLVSGIAFAIMQWYAWGQLVQNSIYFVGNPSGTFVYVISGLHLAHVVAAVVFAGIMLFETFR